MAEKVFVIWYCSAMSVFLSCQNTVITSRKVPFYCAAWSNIKSVRNALKSGFKPAWVELTARDSDFVDRING